jgi:hypothetical protein
MSGVAASSSRSPTSRGLAPVPFAAHWAYLLAFGVGLVSASIVSTVEADTRDDDPGIISHGAGPTSLDGHSGSFSLGAAGDAGGARHSMLAPGTSADLDIELTNPHDEPLLVDNLRVTVVAVDAPHATPAAPCSIADFTVTQSAVALTLRARATVSLSGLGVAPIAWPKIGMINAAHNQDGCKSASLTFALRSEGVVVP